MKKSKLATAIVIMAVALTGLILIGSPVFGPVLGWLDGRNQQVQAIKGQSHQPVDLPVKIGKEDFNAQAKSALLIDYDTATVLYAKNSDARLPIASISKLATVLVIMQKHALDEVVTIPALPTYHPEAVKLGLVAGQQFRLDSLLKALLIPSANDVADALAIYHSGSIKAFTEEMNRMAAEWGIADVNFTTASGLTEINNFATARSLAKLAKVALANPTVAAIANQSLAQINDTAGKSYVLQSTNRLLGNGYVIGLKTGYTPEAGQSFLGLANVKGQRVISVVLNSPDRFGESQALYLWAQRNWEWYK